MQRKQPWPRPTLLWMDEIHHVRSPGMIRETWSLHGPFKSLAYCGWTKSAKFLIRTVRQVDVWWDGEARGRRPLCRGSGDGAALCAALDAAPFAAARVAAAFASGQRRGGSGGGWGGEEGGLKGKPSG